MELNFIYFCVSKRLLNFILNEKQKYKNPIKSSKLNLQFMIILFLANFVENPVYFGEIKKVLWKVLIFLRTINSKLKIVVISGVINDILILIELK